MLTDVSTPPSSCSSADPALGLVWWGSHCCSQYICSWPSLCCCCFSCSFPSHLALLCCARYHRRLLRREFEFLGFLHSLCLEDSWCCSRLWALCQGAGCTGEFCHFVSLASAVEMFWSRRSLFLSVRLFPDLGSHAGWLPLLRSMICVVVHATIHTCRRMPSTVLDKWVYDSWMRTQLNLNTGVYFSWIPPPCFLIFFWFFTNQGE